MDKKDKQNKDSKKPKQVDPLVSGAVGLVAGALGTAAIAMSDKAIRNRAKKIATDAKENLEKNVNEVKDKVKA